MKFVNHDALAGNIFNLDHCSSSPSQVTWLQCVTGMTADCRACLMRACQVPWSRHVTNDLRLLRLLVDRMERDWLATTAKMRRPWNLKEVASLLTGVCV